jgi:hypothetical protein
MLPKVFLDYDASGALKAAKMGHLVVIVDVIDMSTSLETALEMGAVEVYGASPDNSNAPVYLNPEFIATVVATKAKLYNLGIILIGEPRYGCKEDIIRNCLKVYSKINSLNAKIYDVVPNIGKDVGNLTNFKNKIVIAVTNSGGVAFDAAFNAGGTVVTATVARTLKNKGIIPAQIGINRALKVSKRLNKNISIIAASSNSIEDVLAANYLYDQMKEMS